jgi:hypothetical protein
LEFSLYLSRLDAGAVFAVWATVLNGPRVVFTSKREKAYLIVGPLI